MTPSALLTPSPILKAFIEICIGVKVGLGGKDWVLVDSVGSVDSFDSVASYKGYMSESMLRQWLG